MYISDIFTCNRCLWSISQLGQCLVLEGTGSPTLATSYPQSCLSRKTSHHLLQIHQSVPGKRGEGILCSHHHRSPSCCCNTGKVQGHCLAGCSRRRSRLQGIWCTR